MEDLGCTGKTVIEQDEEKLKQENRACEIEYKERGMNKLLLRMRGEEKSATRGDETKEI